MSFGVQVQHKHFVLGHFESGKSHLVRWLIDSAPRALVFDHLHEHGDAHEPWVVHTVEDLREVYPEYGRGILQSFDAENDLEEWAWYCLEAANCLAWLEEPALIFDGKMKLTAGVNHLMRLGHKRGVGFGISTHRLKGDVPPILRMVHHFWAFYTPIASDRDTLADYIGDDGAEFIADDKPKYGFWHHGPSHQGPVDPLPKDLSTLRSIPAHGRLPADSVSDDGASQADEGPRGDEPDSAVRRDRPVRGEPGSQGRRDDRGRRGDDGDDDGTS